MRAWEVMLVKRERENETVPCNVGERSEGSSDTRGEWRGGGAGNADGRGRGIEDGVGHRTEGKTCTTESEEQRTKRSERPAAAE